MRVWTYIKKPRMLLYQRFVTLFMNTVYTSFHTDSVNVDVTVFLLVWFVLALHKIVIFHMTNVVIS